MRITLDIHLIINCTRTLKRTIFQVQKEEDIPPLAYNWIRSVRRETGYYGNESIIEKVIWNADKDITIQVKAIDEAPIPE
jgi:hypothetical protein